MKNPKLITRNNVSEAEQPTGFYYISALSEYFIDAFQRNVLFLDVLRKRGNEQEAITSQPMSTVLTFEHDIIMSGRSLPRPINYSLAKIIPPAGSTIKLGKAPVIIVDSRAGQGPGIGGQHLLDGDELAIRFCDLADRD